MVDRLKSKREFQFVFNQPRKIKSKYFLALFKPNQQSHARLGILVSKHLIKHAVDRNQLKRVVRESFRHHKDILNGLDIIVLVRPECSSLDKKTWRYDIDNLWQLLAASLNVV